MWGKVSIQGTTTVRLDALVLKSVLEAVKDNREPDPDKLRQVEEVIREASSR